jgi:uncharacterized membrane protein
MQVRPVVQDGWKLAGALGLGAGLMYLLDPEAGRRRRHALAQRAGRTARRAGDGTARATRDATHRVHGLFAAARNRFRADDASSETVARRIRSRLGHVVSHPHAIDVSVEDGRVVLEGPILASEVAAAVSETSRVPGVEHVDNRLYAFESAEGVPALQANGHRRRSWAPGVRLFAGASGGALIAYGVRRALRRRSVARRGDGMSKPVRLTESITIDAPVSRVFDEWSRLEQFPRFMSGVKEVREAGRGLTHWRVEGPAGVDVEWDAETVEFAPDRRIAWTSVHDSAVDTSGAVEFEPIGDHRTRVTVHLGYTPPGGALGDAAARLFGADARSRLEEDLREMKAYVEGSRPARDTATSPDFSV